MDLASALRGVAGYGHRGGKEQPAQKHLEALRREPPAGTPVGLDVLASGRAQSLPEIPWIALLDPDVTRTAKQGLYIVYLYNAAITTVSLSMNQGVTQHLNRAIYDGLTGGSAERRAIEEIAQESSAIRAALDPGLLSGLEPTIELGSPRFLPRAYEKGNIAAISYDLDSLPTSEILAKDLQRFAGIYQRCVEIKDALAANQQVHTSARSEGISSDPEPQPEFKPKDAHDYLVHVKAATQRKTRKHEALVLKFGEAVRATGRTAATNVHPRDLVVVDGDETWLVEAKTVGVNAQQAARDAIGQLLAYRHFYYRSKGKDDPKLLALFNAPIGEAFETFLESLGIQFVCLDAGVWRGSSAGSNLLH